MDPEAHATVVRLIRQSHYRGASSGLAGNSHIIAFMNSDDDDTISCGVVYGRANKKRGNRSQQNTAADLSVEDSIQPHRYHPYHEAITVFFPFSQRYIWWWDAGLKEGQMLSGQVEEGRRGFA